VIALAALFFATALLYSVAGFGGGSTYTALLVLTGVDYRVVPIVSLLCNVIVVGVGTWRFARGGHFDGRRAWPLFVASIPAAWLGGRLMIGEMLFVGLLGASLLVAGLLMLWQPAAEIEGQSEAASAAARRWVEPVAGAGLGFVAGVVGIGGGIFLAPLLYLLRWGPPKRIAATCAAFILVNSLAGLAGQASKGLGAVGAVAGEHALLFPAVAAGGMIGAWLGSDRLDPKWVRILTALLILYVAARLLLRLAS
jgi:uncharacterized membrane protein YfcA